ETVLRHGDEREGGGRLGDVVAVALLASNPERFFIGASSAGEVAAVDEGLAEIHERHADTATIADGPERSDCLFIHFQCVVELSKAAEDVRQAALGEGRGAALAELAADLERLVGGLPGMREVADGFEDIADVVERSGGPGAVADLASHLEAAPVHL